MYDIKKYDNIKIQLHIKSKSGSVIPEYTNPFTPVHWHSNMLWAAYNISINQKFVKTMVS